MNTASSSSAGAEAPNAVRILLKNIQSHVAAPEHPEHLVGLLLKLGRDLNSVETREAAARLISNLADELFGWDACTVDLYSDDQQQIFNVISVDTVDGQRTFFPTTPARFVSARARRILEEGGELVLRQGQVQFPTDTIPYGNQARPSASLLNVPIRNAKKVIGVFSIQSYKPNAYKAEDLATLQALADYCAGALDRIRSGEDLRQREEKLRLFAQRLELSNRELEEFASVASHDLQEPLRKISVFGDRLKKKCGEALGADGADYLERMLKAAGRMQTLINELLTYSRVTKKSHPFGPVDLDKVAQEILSDLEARIEQVGGTVELSNLATIEAEPMQMRQLLQNLIGNALKFHRPNVKPVVKVEGRNFCETGTRREMFELTVSDNGVGFDEKYLDRLFQVFQRLHGRGEFEGTGLGLAITRRIAERHGGYVAAHGKLNEGATFVITLPVKQEPVSL